MVTAVEIERMNLFDEWSTLVAEGRVSTEHAVDMIEAGIPPYTQDELPAVDVLDGATSTIDADPYGVVVRIADALGRKFVTTDITHGGVQGQFLYETAEAWLPSQTNADFEWLADLARKYARGGGLSDGQSKGVLNCLVAAERRKARGGTEVSPRTTKPVVVEDEDDKAYDAWTHELSSRTSRGYYTTIRENGSHRTVKIGMWRPDNRRPDSRIRWIGFLNGPVNTGDYQTFGYQTDDGVFTMTRRYADNTDLRSAAELVLFGTKDSRDEQRHLYAVQSGNCARCNRVLTVPASIAMGLGPECAGKAF